MQTAAKVTVMEQMTKRKRSYLKHLTDAIITKAIFSIKMEMFIKKVMWKAKLYIFLKSTGSVWRKSPKYRYSYTVGE